MKRDWLWDRKISLTKAKKILTKPDHPKFIALAALLLSRKNNPKEVFQILSPDHFCQNMKKGFTLIEMIISIVIMVILAGVTIILIHNSIKGIQLSSAADKLASDLRYAQISSGSAGKWYGVSFEVSPANRYTIYTTTGTIETPAENPAKLGTNFVVNLGQEFGVNISSILSEGGNKIVFSPLGVPYTNRGGSAFTQEAVVVLSKDSSTRSVRVFPTTGRVVIE